MHAHYPNASRTSRNREWARTAKLAVLVALINWFSQSAEAEGPNRRHHVSHRLSLDVQPPVDIETRVEEEVSKAKHILESLNTENLVTSPYLVSAIYYHDGFLSGFPADRSSADPERRIIGQISNLLTPERKASFVRLLDEIWARSDSAGPERSSEPVITYSVSNRVGRSHRYAIDLFAPEGAVIHAVSRGMVVLADRDWRRDELFSTTSRKGGNAVIVFDPDHDRFYRYCHMSTVEVSSGHAVAAGEIIGTIGHSGLSASQPGHGNHLHFEANEYLNGRVRAMDYRELRSMLHEWHSLSEVRFSNNGIRGGPAKSIIEESSTDDGELSEDLEEGR